MEKWLNEFKKETEMLGKLQLEVSSEMVVIATVYQNEGMEGVIRRFLGALNLKTRNTESLDKILEFSQEIRKYNPEISKKIGSSLTRRLVHQAQWEQSRHNNNGSKPACGLGEAIFGKSRFDRLLRATV